MPDKPTLAALEAALNQAEASYRDATEVARAASRDQTDTLNRLNAAQKAIDDRLAEIRKLSPNTSDWGRPAGLPAS